MNGEKGSTLPMALIALAMGALLIVPFLQHAYTGLKAAAISEELTVERYSADAGIEDAIWRLKVNKDGFTDSVTPDNPSASYSITVNGIEVFITVEIPQPPDPEPPPPIQSGHHLHVGKSTNKSWLEPKTSNTTTYTIEVTNYGTSTLHLGEISDTLPRPFLYVSGSSSGMTTNDPTITWVNNRQLLTWSFSGADKPTLISGETKTQTFQASVTPGSGIYYNEASATDDPNRAGTTSSGPAAPVAVGVYEIRAQARRATIQATAAIDSTEATIVSWQVE